MNKEDGHPSTFTNNSFYRHLSDDDNSNKATLYNYDIDNEKLITLDKLKSIKKLDNSPLRCDLHPRVSSSKKYLSIDSMRMVKDRVLSIKLKDKKYFIYYWEFFPLQGVLTIQFIGSPKNYQEQKFKYYCAIIFEKNFSNVYSKHGFSPSITNKDDHLNIIFLNILS